MYSAVQAAVRLPSFAMSSITGVAWALVSGSHTLPSKTRVKTKNQRRTFISVSFCNVIIGTVDQDFGKQYTMRVFHVILCSPPSVRESLISV